MEKEIRQAIHEAALIAALEARLNYEDNKKIIPTKICDEVEKFVWEQFLKKNKEGTK